jgi:hypothetical protein
MHQTFTQSLQTGNIGSAFQEQPANLYLLGTELGDSGRLRSSRHKFRLKLG